MEFARLGPAPVDPRAEETMVAARDGVRLATDVYLPEDPGRHPAVLVRLPYDKCGRYTFMQFIAPYFTDRGYVFVVQDVAGKFRSEGETVPYVREIADGYDTIEWIIAQPWSDGVVGMWGDSYYGFTQWAAVASGHPALRAIVPRVTSANLMTVRLGERWDEGIAALYSADYFAHYWLDNDIYEFEVDWSHRPLAEVFDDAFLTIGRRAKAIDQLIADSKGRPAFDMFAAGHPFDTVRIPVFHAGGWFDNIAPDQMRDYTMLMGRKGTAGLQYLMMNSTDHENYQLEDVPVTPENDHDSNEEALTRMLPRYVGPGIDFFDVHLRGKTGPAIPRVRWHLGHVGWQTAQAWPPPGAREIRFHLADPSRATMDAEGGALSASAEAVPGDVRWTHDPANLVPSTVEDPFAFLHEYPDEREVESREDVLTFTSDRLDEPLDLAGPVSLTLGLGSSAPSTGVFAKLVDVFPDGSARMLVRGQALLKQSVGDRPAHVDLGHTGYRMLPGHRLRVHVASSDFPIYLWNPGTSENPWTAKSGTRSGQTLTSGGSQSSFLSLWTTDSVKR